MRRVGKAGAAVGANAWKRLSLERRGCPANSTHAATLGRRCENSDAREAIGGCRGPGRRRKDAAGRTPQERPRRKDAREKRCGTGRHGGSRSSRHRGGRAPGLLNLGFAGKLAPGVARGVDRQLSGARQMPSDRQQPHCWLPPGPTPGPRNQGLRNGPHAPEGEAGPIAGAAAGGSGTASLGQRMGLTPVPIRAAAHRF
jgi:hypothetical protein